MGKESWPLPPGQKSLFQIGCSWATEFCRQLIVHSRQQHEGQLVTEAVPLCGSSSLQFSLPSPYFRFLPVFLFCGPWWVPPPPSSPSTPACGHLFGLCEQENLQVLQTKLCVWSSISNLCRWLMSTGTGQEWGWELALGIAMVQVWCSQWYW